jgi:hypothetical protein
MAGDELGPPAQRSEKPHTCRENFRLSHTTAQYRSGTGAQSVCHTTAAKPTIPRRERRLGVGDYWSLLRRCASRST